MHTERKPLFGRRVVVTRAREQQSDFAELLEGYGAEVIRCPTIAFLPPEDWKALDQSLERIGSYDWVIFTSANGVRSFVGRLREKKGDLGALHGVRVATIGPATAATLEEAGLRPDLVPDEYRAEAILEALDRDLRGMRFFIPRAAEAREVLPAGLRERGAHVDVVAVYRTVQVADEAGALLNLLRAGQVADHCRDRGPLWPHRARHPFRVHHPKPGRRPGNAPAASGAVAIILFSFLHRPRFHDSIL